jgi:hypothetical protein
MKRKILLLLSTFLLTFTVYAQIEEGNYRYSNEEISLTFTIIDGGWAISEVVLTHKKTGKSSTGTGEWFKLNMNGVDPGYNGPEGWYQFETKDCYYEFNEPTKTLILVEGCKANDSKKYTLKIEEK